MPDVPNPLKPGLLDVSYAILGEPGATGSHCNLYGRHPGQRAVCKIVARTSRASGVARKAWGEARRACAVVCGLSGSLWINHKDVRPGLMFYSVGQYTISMSWQKYMHYVLKMSRASVLRSTREYPSIPATVEELAAGRGQSRGEMSKGRGCSFRAGSRFLPPI